jgi:multiple sugar transport system substrate-binding protein
MSAVAHPVAIGMPGLCDHFEQEDRMSITTKRISRRSFIKGATALAGGALLAACGGAAAPAPTAAPAQVEPTKGAVAPTAAPKPSGPQKLRLSVWADVQDAAVYSQMLLNFMGKQKGTEVTMEQYPGDYYAKIQANFAAGDPADVLYFQGWIMQAYAENEVIMPLDDMIGSADLGSKFYKGTNYENLTKWHGKTYMTPTDVGSLAILYNKDLFDKRGVPYPKKGWKWEDFQAAIQKLSFEEGGVKYYGWAQAGGWNGSYGRVDAFIRRNGYLEWDQVIEPKKALWVNPDVTDTLQFLIYDAIKNNWSPSPDVTTGGGVGVDTGRCAMVFEGPWYIPRLWGDLATMKDKGGINFDAAEPPVGTLGKNTTFGHVHGHCIATATKNVSGATELIKYVLSDEGQTVVANGGRMTGHPDNIDKIWGPIVSKKFNFKNVSAYSNGMREGATPLIMGQGTELNAYGGGPINKLWDQLLGLQKTAKEAVPEANDGIQALLDDYWKSRK